MAAKLQRKVKRKMMQNLYTAGDEVWMHCKPDDEELRNWRIKNRCTFEDGTDAERGNNITAMGEGQSGNASEIASGASLKEKVGENEASDISGPG